MNSLLVKLVVGLLKFLLRLVILAITGEWVDLDKVGKSARPMSPSHPDVKTQTPDRAQLAQRFAELHTRQSSTSQAARAHYERFAREFGGPLEQHLRDLGVSLRKRTFVALTELEPAEATLLRDVREYTRYWPMVLSSSAGVSEGSLAPYVVAAKERARALAEDAPGLLNRVRLAHGWPAFLLLSGVERPELLRGAFGVWLGPLVAEVLITLQLGPGYTRFLARSLGPVFPEHSVPTRFLSEEPPLLVRLYASLATLEFLGYFDDAERIEEAVAKQVGDAPDLILPTGAMGNPQALPHELWRAELAGVLESILEDAQPALGGGTLLDAPGIAFLHGEHARALRLSAALGEDPPARSSLDRHAGGSARDWLAAALLAATQEDAGGLLARGSMRTNEAEIARRLRRMLGGPVASRAVEHAGLPPAVAQGQGAPRSLGKMLRDPGVIRDAVVLGAVLGPRANASGRGVRGRSR